MRGKVLITRPMSDAEEFAKMLARLEIQSFVEPLSQINYIEITNSIAFDVLVVTSKNALLHESIHQIDKSKPVFVVGRKSGEIARSKGFSEVDCESSNVLELVERIDIKIPKTYRLLYLRGRNVKHDLPKMLPAHKIFEIICYEASMSDALSCDCVTQIKNGKISSIAFFSSRHAENFIRLCHEHNILNTSGITAYCMSKNIAQSLANNVWKQIVISPSQTLSSMIEIIANQH